MLKRVKSLVNRVSMKCMDKNLHFRVERDLKDPIYGRVFIQIEYSAECAKTNKSEVWRGRKHYLSKHMPDDEIIKTMYLAFKLAVEHEIMEGFKVDNIILFNPHINFEELLKISHKEVTRKPMLSPVN